MAPTIMPRTKLINAVFDGGRWQLEVEDQVDGKRRYVTASQLVNAAGPWVDDVLRQALGRNDTNNIRLVGGSHIVIKRRLPDDRAYMFQNADGRVIFAIPYETDYLMIGTTDNDEVSLGSRRRLPMRRSNICATLPRITYATRSRHRMWSGISLACARCLTTALTKPPKPLAIM